MAKTPFAKSIKKKGSPKQYVRGIDVYWPDHPRLGNGNGSAGVSAEEVEALVVGMEEDGFSDLGDWMKHTCIKYLSETLADGQS